MMSRSMTLLLVLLAPLDARLVGLPATKSLAAPSRSARALLGEGNEGRLS